MFYLAGTSKDHPRASGPKLHTTPAVFGQLDGPGFKFVLNHKDHRFTVTYQRKITGGPSIHWEGQYSQFSFSRSFNSQDVADWTQKLKACHEWAWTKWAIAVDVESLHEPGVIGQEPGVISEAVINEIKPLISQLPDKTVYGRK